MVLSNEHGGSWEEHVHACPNAAAGRSWWILAAAAVRHAHACVSGFWASLVG